MISINQLRLVALCAGLTLLTGCIRSPLKKNIQLKPINTEKATYEKTAADITVQAQVLSKKETKKLLGTTIKDSDVIQVTVINDTRVAYELKKSNIDLELLSNRLLAQELNTFNRHIKDIAIPTVCAAVAVPSFVGYLAGTVKSSGVLALGSVAGGIGVAALSSQAISRSTRKTHKNTYSLLRHLSPKNLQIMPATTASMLLFVDNYALPDTFNLGLCPVTTQNLTHSFTVTL